MASLALALGAVRVEGPGLAEVLRATTSSARTVPGPATRDRLVVGRDADRDALMELLSEPGVITLKGPGGIGKTALARTLADLNRKAWSWRDQVAHKRRWPEDGAPPPWSAKGGLPSWR
jgi:hypothetical protein